MSDGLTLLAKKKARPVRKLEAFPNRSPDRRYAVTLVCPEFTCVCPLTGQPDFGTITIHYVPDRRILESKSLKLYLWSYREEGTFHEHVTNRILDDVVRALEPWSCKVTGAFNARGGISINVEAEYSREAPQAPREAPQTPREAPQAPREAHRAR
ncbi:MAG: preQ(1) synthase [Spirochaetia bacterium]